MPAAEMSSGIALAALLLATIVPGVAQAPSIPSISRSDDGDWQSSAAPRCSSPLGTCDEQQYASDATKACCGCDNFADKGAGLACGLLTLTCLPCDELSREHCPVTCPPVCDQGGIDGMRCKLSVKTLDIGCESVATASACTRIPYIYLVLLAIVGVMMLFACFPKLCLPCKAVCCAGKCMVKLVQCVICKCGESEEERKAREKAARRARRAKRPRERPRKHRSDKNETFLVSVPRNMRAGQDIEFQSPEGFLHVMTIPAELDPSRCFQVSMPKRDTLGDDTEVDTEETLNPSYSSGDDRAAGWVQREHQGRPYYVNTATGERSWNRPSAPRAHDSGGGPSAGSAFPVGWVEREHQGRPYYVNTATGERSWNRPS